MAKTLGFSAKAWVQMWTLTQKCPTEISALGLLHPTDDCLVQEFFVPKQRCDGVYTAMEDSDLAELSASLEKEGYDLSRLRVFWHSHVDMATGPSGTDLATFDRLANGAFLWSIITNKQGANKALIGGEPGNGLMIRLDMYDPVKHEKKDSIYRNTVENCNYYVAMRGLLSSKWADAALGQIIGKPQRVFTPPARAAWVAPTPADRENFYPDGSFDLDKWREEWAASQNRSADERQGLVKKLPAPSEKLQKKEETYHLGYWGEQWLQH